MTLSATFADRGHRWPASGDAIVISPLQTVVEGMRVAPIREGFAEEMQEDPSA